MTPVEFNSLISGVGNVAQKTSQSKSSSAAGGFADLLSNEVQKQSGVKISAHAQKRLAERNLVLSDSEQQRLSDAVDKIEQKGADKSLVLMDNMALLVSARNRTVITAVDSTSAKDGVFTNIDSAMII